MTRFLSVGLVFSLALMLGGCGESVELHRQLSEQDANEVIADLADKHIRAQKVPAKDGVVVRVNAADISRAVRTLEAVGLPKVARATMGDTFRKEGACAPASKNLTYSCVRVCQAPPLFGSIQSLRTIRSWSFLEHQNHVPHLPSQ